MSSTSLPRGRRLAAAAVASTVGLAALAAPASANPGNGKPSGPGSPASHAGESTIAITSATTVAKGQKLSFVGSGYALGAQSVGQKVSVKLDAWGPGGNQYTGTGDDALGDGILTQVQVQADGTLVGSITVPNDIDDPAANPPTVVAGETVAGHAGPHFLRALGSAPGTSEYTQDFVVSGSAPAPATVTAQGAVTAGRGVSATLTLNATGFGPGEEVSLARATGYDHTAQAVTSTPLSWIVTPASGGQAAVTAPTITADAEGRIVNKQVALTPGVLGNGEHQLLLTGTSTPVSTAEVTMPAAVTAAGIAQGSTGTVTVHNVRPNSVIGDVLIDEDGDESTTADQRSVLPAPVIVTSGASQAITVQVPADQPIGYGKTILVKQTAPFATTLRTTSKVSPNEAPFNVDRFTIAATQQATATAPGAVKEGLYQSAYSPASRALFVTTAYSTTASATDPTSGWDGTLYKLDPTTLAVLDSERAGFVSGTSGARYATYGVGVDDTNGTVWVTNTRQNTVAVYSQDDLSLLKQHVPSPSDDVVDGISEQEGNGHVTHSRDVLHDPASDLVFVTSASEGTGGKGSVAVFEADDNDGDGTKYEKVMDTGVLPRTEFSPMTLALDPEEGKVWTVSLQSAKAMWIDTADPSEFGTVDLPGLGDVGSRGASGLTVDSERDRLFITSQDEDLLLITDLAGHTIKEIPSGAGALNVEIDKVNKLVYVANFGGTSVTVTDYDGTVVARLPIARANHVESDGSGSVFVVNKASGNQVFKVTPKPATTPTPPGTTTPPSTTPPPVVADPTAALQAKVAQARKKLKKLKKAGAPASKIAKAKKKLKKAKKALKAAA